MASESPVLEICFRARPAALAEARGELRARLARWGAEDRVADDIVLAVGEACQNIIRHAYADDTEGMIELRARRHEREIEISLRDFAEEVDRDCLNRGRGLQDLRPGGLGTHFIRELMDVAEFVDPPGGRGNLLRMVKHL